MNDISDTFILKKKKVQETFTYSYWIAKKFIWVFS